MKPENNQQPGTGAGFTDSPGYFNKNQVAHHLGVSTRTIDTLMAARKLPFIKLTRKLVRFPKSEVDAYLARHFRINTRD